MPVARHVDLTNLRALIDQDVELEQQLVEEFFRDADRCIEQLALSTDANQQEAWHQHAHVLKGLSFNLGAYILGDLAKDAQEATQLFAGQKQGILDALRKEYAAIKQELGR